MATQMLSRTLSKTLALSFFISRSLSTASSSSALLSRSPLSFLHRLRPIAVASADFRPLFTSPSLRAFSTRATSSSLNDPNPNWSNRPPKETILLDGCDFEHWLVVMEKPEGEPTRDEIIDSYIKTLAQVVGSEEEARMKIYSVSTRHYYAFGALVSEELSYKIKELPRVRWVLPDSYLDVKNKDYGGEPFINGQAVPYDPKYHEEWVRNNARANERNRRNDRPRNADRSRNFDRRRENIVNRDMQNRPPMYNQSVQNPGPNMGGAPPSNMGGAPLSNASGYAPNNMGGAPPNNAGGFPPMGGVPLSNMGGAPQSNMGGVPPSNMRGAPLSNASGYPPNNMNGYPPNNMNGYPPNNMSGAPPNNAGGFPASTPGSFPPNNGGGFPASNAGSYSPNNAGGFPPSNAGSYSPNNAGGYPPKHMGGVHSNSGYGGMPPNSAVGGMTPSNMGGMPPNQNMGGVSPNAGWSSNFPGGDHQPNYTPNRDMGGTAGGNPYSA